VRALIVANTGDDDPGFVGERMVQRGYEIEMQYRDQPSLPVNAGPFDVIVLLGSDWSVYWDHVADDVVRESQLVRSAADNDVPLLGICYGAQLMSYALGGSVEPAHRVEIGWFTIDTEDDLLAAPGPWFEYHIDKFTAPPDAKVIADSPAGPQAYRLGRMLAVQFHPEVTPGIVRRWASSAGASDDERKYGIDFPAVITQSAAVEQQSRERCHAFVDAFLDTFVAQA
jgi:GMP synthase-like glutamine amidotransferase